MSERPKGWLFRQYVDAELSGKGKDWFDSFEKRITYLEAELKEAEADSKRLDTLDSLSEEQKEDFIFELNHVVGPIRDLIDKLEGP